MKHIKTYNKVNESSKYTVAYSDGVRGGEEFKQEWKAIAFAKALIKSNKRLQYVSVHKPGMTQTAHREDLVAWWGPGDMWDNKAKKDKSLYDLQIKESKLTEANMNSEILDVVEDLQTLIKKLKKDSNYKKRPEVEKLFTYAGPIVKELHKLVEDKVNESDAYTLNEAQGKLSTKDLKIIQALIKDPNAKLSYQEKSILKKLIGESIDEGTYIDLRIVNENVTDEIEQALSHWLNTLAEGDSVKMSDLYLDDGVLLGTLAPEILQGRLQIQEYFEMFLGKNPIGSIDSFILQNFGDICIADGTYTFELDGEDGGRTSVAARYTYVWKKENKKWMIATHHSSVNPN